MVQLLLGTMLPMFILVFFLIVAAIAQNPLAFKIPFTIFNFLIPSFTLYMVNTALVCEWLNLQLPVED
jgi:hypothetical protein